MALKKILGVRCLVKRAPDVVKLKYILKEVALEAREMSEKIENIRLYNLKP